MTNDTQADTDESGRTNSATVKRRDVIVGLGAAGVFAGAASGQSQDSVGATIGGGPMSSEVSHLQIEWAEGSLSERPDAGVENRYFRVADESDAEYGTVYRDDGSSWEKVDVGFGSVTADDATINQNAVQKIDEGETPASNKDNSTEYHQRSNDGTVGRKDVNHIEGLAQTSTVIGSGGRGAFLFVFGTLDGDATTHFSDFVAFNRYGASATVIHEESAGADPRTYSPNGAAIEMSMDANTYNVTVFYLAASPES